VAETFTSVRYCEKSLTMLTRIAPALQELVRAGTTEVLPTLEKIFLQGHQPSGPLQEGIKSLLPRKSSPAIL
jgi:hypothetical protein